MAIIRSGQLIGVCIHHSAVEPGANNITELKARASSYNTSHSKKSWAETIKTSGEFGYPYIEYHYMIAKDGSLLQVQDEKYVLYHAGDNIRGVNSFNLHGIAIMIDGNYENEVPNDNQKLTVVKLIRDIQNKYKIDAMVRGHKETSETSTSCPGKNIGVHSSGWMKTVIDSINDTTYPQTPVEPSELEKVKKELETANETNKTLTEEKRLLEAELKTEKEEAKELNNNYDILLKERDRLATEKNEAIRLLSEYKNSDIGKLVVFLQEIWKQLKAKLPKK